MMSCKPACAEPVLALFFLRAATNTLTPHNPSLAPHNNKHTRTRTRTHKGGGDYYLVANDFPAYIEAQERVDATYRDQAEWTRMSILASAGSAKFSTDRTIQEYADDIWHAKPCAVPAVEG